MTSLEAVFLFLAVIIGAGAVGVTSFVVVRQLLERFFERDGSSFEARVLDELEILRLRLDRISEILGTQYVAEPDEESAVKGALPPPPVASGGEEDAG